MLIEGIDDPACTMLALYEPFTTERQLVQQVGRLSRHDGVAGNPIASAYVLARTGDKVPKMWGGFIAFDEACIRNGGKPPVRNDAAVFHDLVKALPEVDYVSGKFRTRVELNQIDLEEELRIPKSAVVFDLEPGFDLGAFQSEVEKGLGEEDRFEVLKGSAADGECRFHVSLRLRPSPFLAEALFHAPSLEATIYARHCDRLFFYDSAGLWIDNADQRDRVQAESLRSLLPDGCFVTNLSMKNTDLGPLSVKSRSISARSLSLSGVFMGEQLHVITQATGRVGKSRRAIGFVRSRVREGEGTKWTPSQFYDWTGAVAAELQARATSSLIFGRFAAPVAVPLDTDPANILIDVDEISDEFVDENGTVAEFDLEHVCVEVVHDAEGPSGFRHRFNIVVNGEPATVWIRWDSKKRKYWVRSDALGALKSNENPRISLTRRLNQKQPFRIVVRQRSTVYAYGGFYAVDLDLRRPGGAGQLILGLTQSVSALGQVTSEKGNFNAAAPNWPNRSLFNLIDRALRSGSRVRPLGEPFAALVCDDLGNEVADFIAIDEASGGETPRAAFVVAKHKAGVGGVSASALYDVCSQAAKNLAYLKADATELPGNPGKWNRDWKLGVGRVPRIRAGPKAAALRSMFSRVRANPSARRSVWLVLSGGILSRSQLADALARDVPEPHVLQLVHLLLSVYSACQSIGVDFRIFCAD
jgi:hypothetical protein